MKKLKVNRNMILGLVAILAIGLLILYSYSNSFGRFSQAELLPDLAISSFKASVYPGYAVAYVTVTNEGLQTYLASETDQRVYVSESKEDGSVEDSYQSQIMTDLAPGESKTYTFRYNNPAKGRHLLEASVSLYGLVAESDYTNNDAYTEYKYGNLPPTVTLTGTVPSQPRTGDKVNFAARSNDDGMVKKVEIYLDNKLVRTCSGYDVQGNAFSVSVCDFTAGPYYVQGRHYYYAVAYDDEGLNTRSQVASFNVQ